MKRSDATGLAIDRQKNVLPSQDHIQSDQLVHEHARGERRKGNGVEPLEGAVSPGRRPDLNLPSSVRTDEWSW